MSSDTGLKNSYDGLSQCSIPKNSPRSELTQDRSIDCLSGPRPSTNQGTPMDESTKLNERLTLIANISVVLFGIMGGTGNVRRPKHSPDLQFGSPISC